MPALNNRPNALCPACRTMLNELAELGTVSIRSIPSLMEIDNEKKAVAAI
jgi:hypothetical protein